eukprot:CAMPEP_0170730622 /NCGR_PEP_ID=MMETSP0437-20130122/627_1 /TAXON_ID=0 /ORGANISM="Sexangularia sp." /LENGTH=180 /DNA_ID=CAMNT_0011068825 /DNA_START=252 /DNA_END=791 /DNA_ORIENTATION=+
MVRALNGRLANGTVPSALAQSASLGEDEGRNEVSLVCTLRSSRDRDVATDGRSSKVRERERERVVRKSGVVSSLVEFLVCRSAFASLSLPATLVDQVNSECGMDRERSRSTEVREGGTVRDGEVEDAVGRPAAVVSVSLSWTLSSSLAAPLSVHLAHTIGRDHQLEPSVGDRGSNDDVES